jgi:hypothetical protein
MRGLLIIALVAGAVSTAHGEIFEWVDSSGAPHFTDNLDNVPAKYRSKVKALESVKEQAPARDEKAVAPPPGPSPVYVKPVVKSPDELRGGRSEDSWRTAFTDLLQQIKKLEDDLPGKKKSLADLHRKRILYSKTSDRIAYYALEDEIKKDETRLQELQQQLQELNVSADRDDVPPGWRQ